MLSFAEQICLLSLDEKTGNTYKASNEILLEYSLISAILCELSFIKKIDIDINADRLIVIDKMPTGNKILDSILSNLPEPEIKKSVSFWVKILLNKAGKTLELVRSDLIDRGVLERVYVKKLWGIHRKIHRIKNNKEINDIVDSVRKLVLNKEEIPNPREAALMGLISACNLFETIFTPREMLQHKNRIENLIKTDPIGYAVLSKVL